MATLTYTGTLIVTSCWCGIQLAIPQSLHNIARENEGHTVCCPLGHKFIYSDTTQEQLRATEAKLREERQRVAATRDLLAQEERSHAASRGHLTRQRKKLEKVVAGVCPVDGCKRHFADLRKHISTKHPAYRGEVGTSQHK